MAAGDLVTQEGQIELALTLMGVGSDVTIHRTRGGVRGLRGGDMKLAESDYAHADGSFIGEVYRASKTITAALLVRGSTVAATNAGIDAMDAVWNRATTEDEPLYLWLPGMAGKVYVMGRPLGIVFEEEQTILKVVPALAMFRLGDDLTVYDAGTSPAPGEGTTVLDGGTF